MKYNKQIFVLIGLFISFVGCTDDFDSINEDPKNFTLDAVTQAQYPLFFERAIYMPHYPNGQEIGAFQRIQSLHMDLYTRYFATSFANFDSDQLILIGGWADRGFEYFYTRVAPNIQYSEEQALEAGFDIENAIMKVWRVYAYHRITDIWGPIPYSEFGNRETSVAYDAQEDIYSDFFVTLDEAVAILKSNSGQTSFVASSDPMYGGDVDKWLRFANTLRLRLAIRIKYADAARSKTEAEKAVADGVIENNSDNAIITTSIDFPNRYTAITQFGEFRMSGDMESFLKGYQDPRVSNYYDEATEPNLNDDPAGLAFNWEGMRNGQTKSAKQGTPFNLLASDIQERFRTIGQAGPDWEPMKAAEAYFLRAEGALEGYNMGGASAQDYYNLGITTSLEEFGYATVDLSGNDMLTSLNVPAGIDENTPAVTDIPVAFDVAGSAERQLEQIITQKWIALYPNSKESYAEKRRTGYPQFYDRLNSLNPDFTVSEIPSRLLFVTSEYNNNPDAVQAAVDNVLGGPDTGNTKVWWDKK